MSYHPHTPNSMYLPNHGYGNYQGKPGPSQPVSPGYNNVIFMQQPPTASYPNYYQTGADSKYPGGGRSGAEAGAAQVYVTMQPSGMVYPGHIPQPGMQQAMILPNGQVQVQPMILTNNPPIPTYPQNNVGRPHMSYNSNPRQQQQYYNNKSSYVPNQPASLNPQPPSTASRRERRMLQIVDPDTGKEVVLKGEDGNAHQGNDADGLTSTSDHRSPSPHQPMTDIAAQFAAQVAATLYHSSSSSGATDSHRTSAAAPATSHDDPTTHHDQTSGATKIPAAAVAQRSEKLQDARTATEDAAHCSRRETSSSVLAPSAGISGSSGSSSGARQPPVEDAARVKDVDAAETSPASNSTQVHKQQQQKQQHHQQQHQQQPVSAPKCSKAPTTMTELPAVAVATASSVGTVVAGEAASVSTKSVQEKLPNVKDIPQQQPDVRASVGVQQQQAKAPVAVPTAPLDTDTGVSGDNGKDPRKKRKGKAKDLNTKGKVLQGSDMDAFIDEGHSGDAHDKATPETSRGDEFESECSANSTFEQESNEVVSGHPEGVSSDLRPSTLPWILGTNAAAAMDIETGKFENKREELGVVAPAQGSDYIVLEGPAMKAGVPTGKVAPDVSCKVAPEVSSTTAPEKILSNVLVVDGGSSEKSKEMPSKFVTNTDDSGTNIASTSATSTNVASTKVTSTNVVSTNVVSTSVTSTNATSTNVASSNVASTKVTSTAVTSTAVTSTAVASTNVASTNVASTDVVSTSVTSTKVVPSVNLETFQNDPKASSVDEASSSGSGRVVVSQVNELSLAVNEVSSVNDKDVTPVSSPETELPPTIKPDKTELKYTYAEEQWSPLNPEGKKQYDRNFMLQLQYAIPSVTKPTGLPIMLDIILNELRAKPGDVSRQASVDPLSPVDFTPEYIKQSPSSRSRGPPGRGGGGGGGGRSGIGAGGGGMKSRSDQKKVINLKLEHDITLHTTDNAWKPVVKKEGGELSATEDLYRKVRGILNKLTPQKFQTLIQQVQHLPIDSEMRLNGCIDILFEKAISEPNFSVAYANMAKCLINMNVPTEADPNEKVGFRKLLLNKCQKEFEKDKLDELDIERLQSRINDETTSDEDKKKLTIERNDTMSKAKRRSLGNIRFIGELFKLRMLTEKIMHECLKKLLNTDDEDSLECLCQLMTTIGQDIDKKKESQLMMNNYFGVLQQFADKKKTSSRIRFMMQDVMDLRKHDWVPRREKFNPKTIEQIHKEAEIEAQEKQAMIQKVSMEQRNNNRRPPGGGGGGRNSLPTTPMQHGGEDGWTAVGRAPKSIVDPARMKLTKQPMDENVQLGPGGRGMSSWHRGSSGGGKAAQQEAERPTNTPNRFLALGSQGSESMDARNRPNSRSGGGGGGGAYQGRLSGPQGRGPSSRQSQERVLGEQTRGGFSSGVGGHGGRSVLSPSGSRSASQETRISGDIRAQLTLPLLLEPSLAPAAAADTAAAASISLVVPESRPKELSEEEIEKKTKSLMDEYLSGHDMQEAVVCVKELGSVRSLQLFVFHSLSQNLEKSAQARHLTGLLHRHLVKNGLLRTDVYVDGLRSLLEIAEDMVIDIPRIWEYAGELVSWTIGEGEVPMGFLRNACTPLLSCDKAGVLVAEVLHDMTRRMGHHKVAELWRNSGLVWTDFVKPEGIQSFLETQKLLFTEEKPNSSPVQRSTSVEQLQETLEKLFNDPNTDVEKLLDWIADNVDETMASGASFIRAFVSSLCNSCLSCQQKNVWTVDQEKLKKYLTVVNKLINHREPMEVHTLYALQAVVHKREHPSGLLRTFFDILYDDEIISEPAFYVWKASEETSEQAGKGVALNSVTQFFHWLENEEES